MNDTQLGRECVFICIHKNGKMKLTVRFFQGKFFET
jgi:hypothetical protein